MRIVIINIMFCSIRHLYIYKLNLYSTFYEVDGEKYIIIHK